MSWRRHHVYVEAGTKTFLLSLAIPKGVVSCLSYPSASHFPFKNHAFLHHLQPRCHAGMCQCNSRPSHHKLQRQSSCNFKLVWPAVFLNFKQGTRIITKSLKLRDESLKSNPSSRMLTQHPYPRDAVFRGIRH